MFVKKNTNVIWDKNSLSFILLYKFATYNYNAFQIVKPSLTKLEDSPINKKHLNKIYFTLR